MDYNFVEGLPEDYACRVCTKVMNEPQLTDCGGQHFCLACQEQALEQSDKKQCPHCHSEVFKHVPDMPLKEKVNQLKVYCSNREKGCGLMMKLEELERHLSHDNPDGCGFASIKCRCFEFILRKDMEEHRQNTCEYREVACEYCGEVEAYWHIIDQHVRVYCQEYPVKCPRECDSDPELKRKDLGDHAKVCPLEQVECPFSGAGCRQKVVRKDLESHMESSTQQHLLGLMKAHDALKASEQTFRSTVAAELEDIQKTVQDEATAKSLERITTTLKNGFQLQKEGDQLVFKFPCDSWDWFGPTFTLGDKRMYLALNPPGRVKIEKYVRTLSLMLVSGQLDGQFELKVQSKLDQQKSTPGPSLSNSETTLKLCTKCSTFQKPKHDSRSGQEIGRTLLPWSIREGFYKSDSLLPFSSKERNYELCVITLTLNTHHCSS